MKPDLNACERIFIVSTEPPSARPFQVRHPQEVVKEATDTPLASPFIKEGNAGMIAPMASDASSVPIHFSKHTPVEKHNLFSPSTKNPTTIRTDAVGTPKARRPHVSPCSPASNGRHFVFRSAEEVRQQHHSNHQTDPDERQLSGHTDLVVEGASGTSRTLVRTIKHTREETSDAVVYSKIPENNTGAPTLPNTASQYYNVDSDHKDVTLASAVPPGDQSLTSKVNALRFPGAILPFTTDEPRQVHTPAKRGRPRKPQLPRPGEYDFIGPLNRRGRKSTGEFVPETGDAAETARNANNQNLGPPGKSDTSHINKKRKHGSLGGSRSVYSSGPSLAAVPILVQLAGGEDAPRKLQIRYRDPNWRKSTAEQNTHYMLEVDCEGMSGRRANALIALFDELVYPFIQSLISHYQGFHADEDLQTMGLDVSWLSEP